MRVLPRFKKGDYSRETPVVLIIIIIAAILIIIWLVTGGEPTKELRKCGAPLGIDTPTRERCITKEDCSRLDGSVNGLGYCPSEEDRDDVDVCCVIKQGRCFDKEDCDEGYSCEDNVCKKGSSGFVPAYEEKKTPEEKIQDKIDQVQTGLNDAKKLLDEGENEKACVAYKKVLSDYPDYKLESRANYEGEIWFDAYCKVISLDGCTLEDALKNRYPDNVQGLCTS